MQEERRKQYTVDGQQAVVYSKPWHRDKGFSTKWKTRLRHTG